MVLVVGIMNIYEIKYRTKGSVQVARVSANSMCQAAFTFLEDYDLPVLSVTRTDLLPQNPTDMEMKLYRVIGKAKKALIFANCESDAKEAYERNYEDKVKETRFLRYATSDELDTMAGGAPHPKH